MHCTYVRQGKVCGAPTYQSPCAACLSWERSMRERGLLPPASTTASVSVPAHVPAPMDYPKFRATHALLHHLWTKSVGSDTYDKKEWEELEAAVEDIARNGLGQYAPALAQSYGEDLTASLGPPIPILPPSASAAVSPLPADIMSPIRAHADAAGSGDDGQG